MPYSSLDPKNIIQELREIGFSGIQFIGGEPMLHPDLKDLIEYALKLGVGTIEVFTNGTRINADWIAFFKKHNVKVALSFYSNQSLVHSQITKNRSSFDRIVAAIDALSAAGVAMRAVVIAMQENQTHLNETLQFLRSKGIEDIRVDQSREIGRGCKSGPTNSGDVYKQLCGACGSNKIAIDSNGDVFPCVFSHEFLLGNVSDVDWQNSVSLPLSSFLADMWQELERRRYQNTELNVKACGPRCLPDSECSPDTGSCAPDPPPGGNCP